MEREDIVSACPYNVGYKHCNIVSNKDTFYSKVEDVALKIKQSFENPQEL